MDRRRSPIPFTLMWCLGCMTYDLIPPAVTRRPQAAGDLGHHRHICTAGEAHHPVRIRGLSLLSQGEGQHDNPPTWAPRGHDARQECT